MTSRAARAQTSGRFQREIVPVSVRHADGGAEREVLVAEDDGIRAGTTLAGLSKLRPAFKPDGSTTAGGPALPPPPAPPSHPPPNSTRVSCPQVTPAR